MASVAIEKIQLVADGGEMCSTPVKVRGGSGGEGPRQYYMQHIHELQLLVRQKSHNLNRLEAQRNDLNSKGIRVSASELGLREIFEDAYMGKIEPSHTIVSLKKT